MAKKHPLAIAWNEWKKRSPECFESATLDVRENPDSYLENRLSSAFNAGAAAQRQNYLRALAAVNSLVETGTAVPKHRQLKIIRERK